MTGVRANLGWFVARLIPLGLLFAAVYALGNSLAAGRAVPVAFGWERAVPLVPVAIWLYLTVVLVFWVPLFVMDREAMRALMRRYVAVTLAAGAVFLVFPTAVALASSHQTRRASRGSSKNSAIAPSASVRTVARTRLAVGARNQWRWRKVAWGQSRKFSRQSSTGAANRFCSTKLVQPRSPRCGNAIGAVAGRASSRAIHERHAICQGLAAAGSLAAVSSAEGRSIGACMGAILMPRPTGAVAA